MFVVIFSDVLGDIFIENVYISDNNIPELHKTIIKGMDVTDSVTNNEITSFSAQTSNKWMYVDTREIKFADLFDFLHIIPATNHLKQISESMSIMYTTVTKMYLWNSLQNNVYVNRRFGKILLWHFMPIMLVTDTDVISIMQQN